MPQDKCGSTDTRSGQPCAFPSADNCPHHGVQGLQGRKARAARLLRSGEYTRQEVAKQVGVDQSTLWRWRQKHPELEEARKEGDRAQYVEVVDKWIDRLKEGDHSASEIIFYLKNKSRILEGEDWRDRTEVEHSGEIDTGGETHIYLPDNGRSTPDILRKRQEVLTNGGSPNGSSPE